MSHCFTGMVLCTQCSELRNINQRVIHWHKIKQQTRKRLVLVRINNRERVYMNIKSIYCEIILIPGANVRGLSKIFLVCGDIMNNWFESLQLMQTIHLFVLKFMGKGNPWNPQTLTPPSPRTMMIPQMCYYYIDKSS